MDAARLKAEHVLYGLGVYGPAKALYGMTPSGRRARRDRVQKRAFYAQFLQPGDLIFDVGANLGNYSEIFASLGARVIALEPNPDCVSHIRRSNPGSAIDVVNTAVGATAGVATIRLAKRSDISSMSEEWIDAIGKAQQMDEMIWASELTVPVITLDSLIQRFGKPRFIKIDVEGFEENVLAGLSTQPEILSFEFNTNFLDASLRCLKLLSHLDESTFNYVIGEPTKFELDRWVDANQLHNHLKSLERNQGYGDVFVRRNSTNALAIETIQ